MFDDSTFPWRSRLAPRALPLTLAGALAASLLAGCESRDLREWQATDHRHPPSVPLTADGRARPPANQQLTPAEREVRTATTYWNIFCAQCHGANGQGNGPALPPTVRMASFASAEWQASKTDAQIQVAIANGQGLMPAFAQQVEPEVIALLVRHVRRLGGLVPDPVAAEGGEDAAGAAADDAGAEAPTAPAGPDGEPAAAAQTEPTPPPS